jgi:hypothetical protein
MAPVIGGITMLSSSPAKTLARARRMSRTIAWLEIWAVSLGSVTAGLASFVYFSGRDAVGVSFILFAAAAIILLMLRGSVDIRNRS